MVKNTGLCSWIPLLEYRFHKLDAHTPVHQEPSHGWLLSASIARMLVLLPCSQGSYPPTSEKAKNWEPVLTFVIWRWGEESNTTVHLVVIVSIFTIPSLFQKTSSDFLLSKLLKAPVWARQQNIIRFIQQEKDLTSEQNVLWVWLYTVILHLLSTTAGNSRN